MAQPDDMEARVSALENEVRDLSHEVHVTRQDAAAARVLAGGADRDVMEIRAEIRDFRQATVTSLNALREDQLDIRTKMDAGFLDIREQLNATSTEMRDGFAEMRSTFATLAASQQQVLGVLNTVISRPDGK